MAARPLEELSDAELTARVKAFRSIHYATTGIFVVIIAAWLALGFWRRNMPVFISTVAMAVAITVMQRASRGVAEAELRKRKAAA